VKSGGYGFAIAKATEGSSATDSQFKANWKVRHLKPTDVLNNFMSAEVLNEWPCGLLRFAGDRCCRHQGPRCAAA
jgi:hypothetical protein